VKKGILLSAMLALTGPAIIAAPRPSAPSLVAAADLDRALRLQLGMFRLRAARSFGSVWDAGTPRFRQAAALLAPANDEEAVLWTNFFAHATEAHVIRGNRALAGWRDPLADAWVTSSWTRDGAGWRLDRMSVALSQDLASTTLGRDAVAPPFPGVPLGSAMLVAQHRALKRFRQASVDISSVVWSVNDVRAVRGRGHLLLRLRRARASLSAIGTVAPTAPALLRVALIEETPVVPAVSASIAQRLRALSVETRLSLQPIQFLPGKNEIVAIAQSSFEPAQIYLVHFDAAGPGGTTRITNVESVDLSKVE
jgi:hypothetical protein